MFLDETFLYQIGVEKDLCGNLCEQELRKFAECTDEFTVNICKRWLVDGNCGDILLK